MALTLVKVGTSFSVGAIDLLTEYVDEKQAYTKPFQNITDWGRFLYTVGGYGANYMKVGPEDVTESMVLAGLPLFEKSLAHAVVVFGKLGKGKGRGRMGLKLKKPGQTGNLRYI